MLDPRVTRLAEVLTSHSTRLGPDDNVLIHAFDIPDECVAEIVRIAKGTGANVMVRLESARINRTLWNGVTQRNVELIADNDLHEMKSATAYMGLRGSDNIAESSDVPAESKAIWQRCHASPVHSQQRVENTKWVVLRWPSPSMAQQAMMSTDSFEDFYFRVCTMDYEKMENACRPLEDLMNSTDRVRLIGPGTDISFSIKDIGCKPCVGLRNIPDGECFSCPVKDSVNGYIEFNTSSLFQGTEFKGIRYEMKNGKIIDAQAGENTELINKILDTDDGARYIGEFAIGFNPYILHPMMDTLFDEKIAGSFHFTPGNSYPPPGGNGNKSAIHWDTVMIQRPDYGGGEIWFDDVLIRKDGQFVLQNLQDLNPERLG